MKCSVMFSTLLPCFNEQMCGFCSVFFHFSNARLFYKIQTTPKAI